MYVQGVSEPGATTAASGTFGSPESSNADAPRRSGAGSIVTTFALCALSPGSTATMTYPGPPVPVPPSGRAFVARTRTAPGACGREQTGHVVRTGMNPLSGFPFPPSSDCESPRMMVVGSAKIEGALGAAEPTNAIRPSAVVAISLGSWPTGRKLIPGVVGSMSTTLPAVRSTTATSPRVVCVTSANRWYGSPAPGTFTGTCAHEDSGTGIGGMIARPVGVRTLRHTTSKAFGCSNVCTGTFVGVCAQLARSDAVNPTTVARAPAVAKIAFTFLVTNAISSHPPAGSGDRACTP